MTIITGNLNDAGNNPITGILQINLPQPLIVSPPFGVGTTKTTLLPIVASVPITNGKFSASLPASDAAEQSYIFLVFTTASQDAYYEDDGTFYCYNTDLPWHIYTDTLTYTGIVHTATSLHLSKITAKTQTQVGDAIYAIVPSAIASVDFADLERTGFFNDRTPQTAQQVANILKRDSAFLQTIIDVSIPRGQYDPTTTYQKGNVVSSGGQYFVLKANSSINVAPTASASTPTWGYVVSALDLTSASIAGVAAGGDLAGNYPAPVLAPIASLTAGTYSSLTSLTVNQKGQVISVISAPQASDNSVLPWVDLNLSSGWANVGGGNATAQYRKHKSGLVEVKGTVYKTSAVTSGEAISILPPSCSPLQIRSIPGVGSSNTFANFAIQPSGAIAYIGGNPAASFSIETRHVGEVKTSLSFGDSITVGYGVDPSLRWSKLVANALGAVEDDQGISGTLLQDAANTPYGNSGYLRYQSAILNHYPDYLFILYGINDLRFNDASASVTVFQSELSTIVSAAITSGVKPGNITIGNPPYVNSAAYSAGSPFNAGSLAKQQQYSAATSSVAHSLGTKWADVYTAMQLGGGDSLVFDTLHPNAAGHQIIANALLAATFV
ncbi:MAG: SGNH/GDSL hydrolase family protein [Rhizonema sp. NSF051]|nr:SGNH/GDSL hydrolase family protein [Rhizonema sp. NSF051]